MSSSRATRHASPGFAAALAVLLSASQAAAQTSPPSPAPAEATTSSEARAHFERGVNFYEEADYSAALVEFKRAYALVPTWQVLFNIGQSYFQIREYALALVTLNQFIDEGQDRIPAERRALIEAEQADLANRVGHVTIRCNLPNATISVDDLVVGVSPMTKAVLVSVGVRKITAALEGSQPIEQQISVPTGETIDVGFDFPLPRPARADVSVPIVAPSSRVEPLAPVRGPNRAPAITSFGVAAAGLAVGGVFGALALHDKSHLESECAGKACSFGSQGDIDAVSRDGLVSTIAFGVAGAAFIAGVVLWATAGGATTQEAVVVAKPPPVVSLRWAPGVLSGKF